MWKSVLMALLAMVSTSALSEWTKVEKNNSEDITSYVDVATIQKTENKVRMINLIDYQTVREAVDDKFLSIKVVQEYDCNEVKKEYLLLILIAGTWVKGEFFMRIAHQMNGKLFLLPEVSD